MTTLDTTDWREYRRLIGRSVSIDLAEFRVAHTRRITRFGVVAGVEVTWPSVYSTLDTWKADVHEEGEPAMPDAVTIRFEDHSALTFSPEVSEIAIDY